MGRNYNFKFHISDEINGSLFLLEEADSIRRMPRDRPKLAESIRLRPRSTATTLLGIDSTRLPTSDMLRWCPPLCAITNRILCSATEITAG